MQRMLINYAPSEGCRIAITEDGKLEEYLAEGSDHISRVGNIYLGTVTNVEPAIQAAFVDFGLDQHGFLHQTDVHPRYFPGEDDETTERVGKKTPRRERPPIQSCFRKGQRVLVQVLKEGVGTKGPTLTSYLSIPGRFLVMMPGMDNVGVSRKVEDEEQRRAMREILDTLDLPEGFGFILRTAGMDRTKTELKRDLAYLQRLWRDIDRAQTSAEKKKKSEPLLLYAESDLLVRTLRDLLTTDISELIIDHPLAVQRAARFLKIVSPRTHTKLLKYTGTAPLFDSFGVEQQVLNIHSREVPLPSGGRLVIDETEALVAVDVNSGRSRRAQDSETNAYQTNVEAVDEICRQLKLRDLGGLVILDLIDMRQRKHRADIEQRFRERLKRDRSRVSFLPISEYGILEMTRQRQRSSHERTHFAECPTCRGRGLVQRPDSVAADAVRNVAAILSIERVAKVELVVAPRVAGDLLSARRRALTRIEVLSGKRVDVRVSEAVAVDRVTYYAYDSDGADIDLTRLKPVADPSKLLEPVDTGAELAEALAIDVLEPADDVAALTGEEPSAAAAQIHPIERDDDIVDADGPIDDAGETGHDQPAAGGKKKRRRRRRKGKGDATTQPATADASNVPAEPRRQPSAQRAPASDGAPAQHPDDAQGQADASDAADPSSADAPGQQPPADGQRKKRRRRRRRRSSDTAAPADAQGRSEDAGSRPQPDAQRAHASSAEADDNDVDAEPEPGPSTQGQSGSPESVADEPGSASGKKRRRRRRGRGRSGEAVAAGAPANAAPPPTPSRPQQPRRESASRGPRPDAPPAQPRSTTATSSAEVKPSVRSLYGAGRRKLAASEASKAKARRD